MRIKQKIYYSKNSPKAEQIKAEKVVRKKWNHTIDRVLITGIQEEQLKGDF